jgi:hypothetical protein
MNLNPLLAEFDRRAARLRALVENAITAQDFRRLEQLLTALEALEKEKPK